LRDLVAGGLAVNAHGYLRFTKDVHRVLALAPDNVRAAFDALAAAGYSPAIPVTAGGIADAATRARLARDNGMQVLNLISDHYPATAVDVFHKEPFDFDTEYGRAMIGEISPDLAVRFVCIPTLIRMKEAVGRPIDRDDAGHLRRILEDDAGAH
jgi:hypothetical protein